MFNNADKNEYFFDKLFSLYYPQKNLHFILEIIFYDATFYSFFLKKCVNILVLKNL